jgi:hypothetical protein
VTGGLEGHRQRDFDARTKTVRPDGWVYVYARLALGAAFLSAVASRFGLWDRTLDLKHFAKFLEYTAQVNSFMPPATIPLLGDGCRDTPEKRCFPAERRAAPAEWHRRGAAAR